MAAPPIVGGSHDPLLEWALRESNSGLASLPEGSEEGLRRLTRGEVMIAAIHLHRLDGDDETANLDAVADAPGIARCRGAELLRGASRAFWSRLAIRSASATWPRSPRRAHAWRNAPPAPARNCCCSRYWRAAGIGLDELKLAKPAFPTGPDIAQAVRAGRIDCGIATRAVARSAGLDFLPLTWERFDLVLRQRDYFMTGPQALFNFMRSAGSAIAPPNSAVMTSATRARCGW